MTAARPAHPGCAPGPAAPDHSGDLALTDQQRRAAFHDQGDLLVSAAAGAGKTAVLSRRCAYLVTEAPTPTDIDRLLVVTFTDAAAAEMRTRIISELGKVITRRRACGRAVPPHWRRQQALVQRADICTLHAFCGRLLRTHFHAADVDPLFRVTDAIEDRFLQHRILTEILGRRHTQTDERGEAFARLHDAFGRGSDRTLAGWVRKISVMLDSSENPEAYVAAAERAYTPEGCNVALGAFAEQIAIQLRMRQQEALRGAAQADGRGAAKYLGFFNKSAAMLEDAATTLIQDGINGWDSVRATRFDHPFPKTATNLDRLPPDEWQFLKKKFYDKHRDWWKDKIGDAVKPGELFASTAAEMRHDMLKLTEPANLLLEITQEYRNACAAARREKGMVNFNDLERLALDLLVKDARTRQQVQASYTHVLVDESQDLNPLQEALLQAVRQPEGSGNLFTVGDIKQSIYGFRQAEPRLFLDRQRRLHASTSGAAVVSLPHNFRSQPDLIATMNQIFSRVLTPEVAQVSYDDTHALQAGTRPVNGQVAAPPPKVPTLCGAPAELHLLDPKASGDDGEENAGGEGGEDATAEAAEPEDKIVFEARFIARRITQLLQTDTHICDEKGQWRALKFSDIAVLLRSIKKQAPVFMRTFAEMQVPLVTEQSAGFFDAPEVRQVVLLLKALDNPLEDMAIAGTMLSDIFGGFTHDELARIRLAFPSRHDVPFHVAVAQLADGSAPTAATDACGEVIVGKIKSLFTRLDAWRNAVRTLGLPEGLAEIYQDSGILTRLAGAIGGTQKIINCRQLQQQTLEFAAFGQHGLYHFLEFLREMEDQEDVSTAPPPLLSSSENVVRLMSIHKSKGLEFPVVFVAGLGGQFNETNLRGSVLVDRDLKLGLQVQDVNRDMAYSSALHRAIALRGQRALRAEELRLLYVALTRARNHLVLSGTCKWSDATDAQRLFAQHAGPLPEDLLIKAQCMLDWLLPACAADGVRCAWLESADAPMPEGRLDMVVMAQTPPPAEAPAVDIATPAGQLAERIRAMEPLPAADAPTGETPAAVADAKTRINYQYSCNAFTVLPALFSVSQLKAAATEDPSPDAMPAANLHHFSADDLPPPTWREGADMRGAEGIATLRGTATHQLLQHLDFAAATSNNLPEHVTQLIAKGLLAQEQADMINLEDIAWLLDSQLGGRLRSLAKDAAANKPAAPRLLRELPFMWSMPPQEVLADMSAMSTAAAAGPASALRDGARRDYPLVRGVVDLLIAKPDELHVLDYKTDGADHVEARLGMYRRQMFYYARALEDIFNKKVTSATLIFLAARKLDIVKNPSQPVGR